MKLMCFLCVLVSNKVTGLNHKTKPGFGYGDQDYGYYDVRLGAHMFWWIQFAMNTSVEEAATIFWLPGGPGTSATGMGNIGSVGPTTWAGSYRPGNWAEKYNLLFIDAPIAAGYSYEDHEDYLPRNDFELIRDLYKTLAYIMSEHPELKETPFYLFCNSYGSKTCIEFGTYIHERIRTKEIARKLHGIFLTNPYIDLNEVNKGLSIQHYIWGLIDREMKAKLERSACLIRESLEDGLLHRAGYLNDIQNEFLENSTNGSPFLLLHQRTKNSIVKPHKIPDDDMNTRFDYAFEGVHETMNGVLKSALKIPENVTWGRHEHNRLLIYDDAISKDGFVENLLKNTNVKLYISVGSLDGSSSPVATTSWLKKINWPEEGNFHKAKREMIWVNGVLQGYKKITEQFGFYWLIGAGHMAFYDNPFGTMDMLQSMIGY